MDLGWTMKANSNALQNIAAGQQLSSGTLGSSAMSNAASATGTGAPDKPAHANGKPGPPLAIWDAKVRGKLLSKAEEALTGSYVLSLKFSKVIAHLPATILGSEHKRNLDEMDTVMKQRESLLTHIAINGALPGQSTAIGVIELKKCDQVIFMHFDDLKRALEMANHLLKKVDTQESSG